MKNIIFDIFGVLFEYNENLIIPSLVDSQINPFIPIKQGHDILERCVNLKKINNARLYILSNCNTDFFNILNNHYPDFFKLFDGIVVSAKLNLKKPDKNIYEYLINTYNLVATNCLFIDDNHKNIQTAQDLGMKAVLYNSEFRKEEIEDFLKTDFA